MPDKDPTVAAAEAVETAPEPSPTDAVATETASAWADVKAEVTGEKSDDTEEAPASASADEAGEEGEQGAEEGATEQEAAESETETAAEDVWATAPETLKSAYDSEKSRADKAEHAFRSREGREAALQRRIDSMIASGNTPPANRQSAEDTASTEELSELTALEDDYPEIAKPMKAALGRIEKRHQAEINRLSQALQTVGEERLDARSTAEESTRHREPPRLQRHRGQRRLRSVVQRSVRVSSRPCCSAER